MIMSASDILMFDLNSFSWLLTSDHLAWADKQKVNVAHSKIETNFVNRNDDLR